MEITKSLFYFVVAGFCEIAGGISCGFGGVKARASALLSLERLRLFSMESFPRCNLLTLAECTRLYGGIFIGLSLLWGWQIDRITPDRFDLIGSLTR